MKNTESHTNQLWKELYQNVSMGRQSLDTLIPKVQPGNLKDELIQQQKVYALAESKIAKKIQDKNMSVDEPSTAQKVMLWSSIQLNTVMNRTESHFAEMVIQGNSIGTIDLTRALNEYTEADKDARTAVQAVLETEKEDIETLKKYL